MGFDDKLENTGRDAAGKVKEATGEVTDNERLEAEGKKDQVEADVKNAADDAGDAARDIKRDLTD